MPKVCHAALCFSSGLIYVLANSLLLHNQPIMLASNVGAPLGEQHTPPDAAVLYCHTSCEQHTPWVVVCRSQHVWQYEPATFGLILLALTTPH